MPSPYGEPEQWSAGGTIAPSRFVKVSTAADHKILQSDAAASSYGISQVGQRDAPGLTGSDVLVAANAGDDIQIYPFGCIAGIVCVTTCGCGLFVKADTNGKATPSSSGDVSSGLMIETGTAGQIALCKVLPPGTKMP